MSKRYGRQTHAWQVFRASVIADCDGICSWCGHPIDLSLSGRHRYGPSVDHIVELEDGGQLLDRANAQVLHAVCNSQKAGVRGGQRKRERKRGGSGLNSGRFGGTSRDW